MSNPQKKEKQIIKIPNVRLSFPSLFTTEVFGDDDTGKYAATFILDMNEHEDSIAEIEAQIKAITKEKWKGKSLPDDRLCLKLGDPDRDEMDGKMTIKASTKKRPLVINRDKSPITEDDDIIYAGCYVNAIISLWAQNNKYGKRINGSLEGLQFNGHGEPFGNAGVDADGFDLFSTEDEDIPF